MSLTEWKPKACASLTYWKKNKAVMVSKALGTVIREFPDCFGKLLWSDGCILLSVFLVTVNHKTGVIMSIHCMSSNQQNVSASTAMSLNFLWHRGQKDLPAIWDNRWPKFQYSVTIYTASCHSPPQSRSFLLWNRQRQFWVQVLKFALLLFTDNHCGQNQIMDLVRIRSVWFVNVT